MSLRAFALFAQLAAQPAAPAPAQQTPPVLAFPEPGLDDSAAYAGYQTRFFRDAARNTVQVYLNQRASRIVTLLADGENESVGLTARDGAGRPAALRWGDDGAATAGEGRTRTISYRLTADAPRLVLRDPLLGTMRVERDFQYFQGEGRPFAVRPLAEFARLFDALDRLAPAVRARHLAVLNAASVAALRARVAPRWENAGYLTSPVPPTQGVGQRGPSDSVAVARVVQPSLDGRDTLALDVAADARRVALAVAGDSVTLAARPGAGPVRFTVRVTTTGRALAPLEREEIFTPEFLAFAASRRARTAGADTAARNARWLERQVRAVELLASRDKLFAGLPTYATYFGRDQMVTALMMRPIWRGEVQEAVIGSVLRKLAPDGQVSHEEALGDQADREAAAEYADLVGAHLAAAGRGDRAGAARALARAERVLRDHRQTRENYHMIDDELQFPVLVSRWLDDPNVPAERKRAFLADSSDGGGSRARRLLRALSVVARMTAPYAARPAAANLVAFAPRDSGRWASASWRDSGAGYANGRYAMDVNAIWAPHALEAVARIVAALRALGLPADALAAGAVAGGDTLLAPATPLGRYLRDPAALERAAATWRTAERHFVVHLAPAAVRARVAARVAALPAAERAYWAAHLARTRADADSLTFLAVALDAAGRPLGVANTDPATRLFLGDREPGGGPDTGAAAAAATAAVLRDVRGFVRAYPAGLFVDGVGPVVANDAYAPPAVWQAFARDPYHGPRVVWGREANLFVLGVAARVAAAGADPARAAYVRELRAALAGVQGAVEASGFHSELWSYEFRGGRPAPARYNTGGDVQLWSTSDLAVQYALSRLAM
jgi:hypothetical protein